MTFFAEGSVQRQPAHALSMVAVPGDRRQAVFVLCDGLFSERAFRGGGLFQSPRHRSTTDSATRKLPGPRPTVFRTQRKHSDYPADTTYCCCC